MGDGHAYCWAGGIAQRNGRYYWYFSNGDQETGVMVALTPEVSYVDALGHPLVNSFDPIIFEEDDGTPYIIYGGHDY